jgi:hypothetical protein
MADEQKSLPFIGTKNWFAVRRMFKRRIPPQVTYSLIAADLSMSEQSARANVVGGLRLIGLIDKDDKPTPLAIRWRDDEQYAAVCHEIREAVYPDELLTIAPDASTPQSKVENWIANKLRVGESAASKQAAFYMLLTRANLEQEAEIAGKQGDSKRKRAKKAEKLEPQPDAKREAVASPDTYTASSPSPIAESLEETEVETASRGRKLHPSLHFDIQIHISPETTPDQIDQIFASMAKHLKNL